VTARSARKVCDEPGGDHSPKSWTAVACSGSRPRGELANEQAPATITERVAQDGRRRVGRRSQRGGVVATGRVERGDLGDLAAVAVDDGHPLVRCEREDGRAARSDEIRLDKRILREEPADQCAGVRPHGPDPD